MIPSSHSSPRTPTNNRSHQHQYYHERCADIIGMRQQIQANARLLFGSNLIFEIVVCETERETDSKPLWTARMIRPDTRKIFLEGRTHRDFSSALYGLLSETARALDRQLKGVVEAHRAAVEATTDVLPGYIDLADLNKCGRDQ
ncbi:hypothetical protein BDV97DRAFT_401216 [Delphinella strobiligena]|nr:hypothetical protein BDV97DRAFT_401216 [Delphinella strobiligena]